MNDLPLIGVGASAGGIEALFDLVAGIDADLDAAVLVVVHQAADAPSVLAGLLDRRCALSVASAEGGERLERGRVLVAPPDHHLHVVDGRVEVSRGPKENGHRPGIDPLFRSLALAAGPRATGVVLSGMLDDGAAGLLDLVRHGGTAVVQEPGDALYDGMPTAALEQVPGALVRPAREIGPALTEIVARRPLDVARPSAQLAYEVRISRGDEVEMTEHDPPGAPAGLSCPDCAGPLFDLGSEDRPRYRCRTGHAWSVVSLGAEQDETAERALYAALRALEDKMALARRVASSAEGSGATTVAARSRKSAREAMRSAVVLRRLLTGSGGAANGRADPEGSEGDDGSVR
ncbi:chemotaxis protein CheB [Actinomycetospora flava]|uniref:protein-glutamate methylesterase n=1 Tax=Actinomycetospora flava TaxID=3129232 RepID=A0ABU8MAV9_9PSEU